MDFQDIYLHHSPRTSSSSAVDLTGTPAGLASSAPQSPSLDPSDSQNAVSRRRTSWGRVEPGQDPLRFEQSTHAPTSSSHTVNDDPFYSPPDDPLSLPYAPSNVTTHYESSLPELNTYSTSQAGPSTASLIPPREFDGREDDEAHLTTHMSHNHGEHWSQDSIDDPERSAGATPRSRRRTVRYSTVASPLKRTGTAIKSVSKNLRRVSLRVVNLAGAGLETQMRLADGDDDSLRSAKRKGKEDGDEEEEEEEELPDLSKSLPIRGRTLGFLGPNSKLRLALLKFLVYPYVFPSCVRFFLLLILE